MKTKSLLVILVLSLGTASLAVAQTPAITHNTWSSGTPLPTPVLSPSAGLLKNQIYVLGGWNSGVVLADVQIYDPITNAWSTGVPLPTTLAGASVAVVKNILYVIGGTPDNETQTSAVWAYNPKTQAWSSRAPLPTALEAAFAVVEKNIIYVMGGVNTGSQNCCDWDVFNFVESYNPATNTWTEEAPLLVAKLVSSGGLIAKTIVAADGVTQCCPGSWTGDTEGYDASTNAWSPLNSDPTPRGYACAGTVGSKLYVAGGNDSQGAALGITESFQLSKNAWTTLTPMPQPAIAPASAVYKGQLYCFGGWDGWNGNVLDNVQIYQP